MHMTSKVYVAIKWKRWEQNSDLGTCRTVCSTLIYAAGFLFFNKMDFSVMQFSSRDHNCPSSLARP